MTALARIEQPDGQMTRGGRRKDRTAPERRCIATGESGDTDRLIRFVLSPTGEVVPDLAGKLPGRGAWLTADRALVRAAIKRKAFSRAFKAQVSVQDDLDDQLEALLARRMVETLSLARKAGAAVTGAEKVRAKLRLGDAAILMQATDGAADGIAKLESLAIAAGEGRISRIRVLNSAEMGLAFGREFAIHAALDAGGFAARAKREAARLSGFRDEAVMDLSSGQQTGLQVGQPIRSVESDDDSEAPVTGARKQDDR
ncbi:MAG: RNA-binding protein [Pseudomonadota bacterium]